MKICFSFFYYHLTLRHTVEMLFFAFIKYNILSVTGATRAKIHIKYHRKSNQSNTQI